jgi:hypothetical protein
VTARRRSEAAGPAPASARAAAIRLALVALALARPASGCWRDVKLLPGPPGDGDGSVDRRAETGGPTACTDPGDPVVLLTAAGPTCAAALGARGHRFVLCSCETMTVSARIRTDAFDSRDPTMEDDVAAAVGIGGALQSTAEIRAGGALYVAGAGGVRASDHLETTRSLRVGGPLAMLSSTADIETDAFIAGDVTGDVRVRGTLHVPTTATVNPGAEAGAVTREPVAVPTPCDCSAGFADVAGAIAAAAAAHGDDAARFSPDALAAVTAPARLDLPCGAFYLTGIDTGAAVTLAVHGRALLAVGGDVVLRGPVGVELDPSAELDLLVGGRLAAAGGHTLGVPASPARFRIWIAGSSSVVLDDGPTVGAVIHAPEAPLTAPGGLTLYGSLLARTVGLGAESMLRFDRAILAAGAACGAPAAEIVP